MSVRRASLRPRHCGTERRVAPGSWAKKPGGHPGPGGLVEAGESNPRPKMLDPRYYMLSPLIDLTGGNSTNKAHRAASLLCSRPRATGMPQDHPVIMTLHPRARAQAGSGLGLKRPERRRRRWRLWNCHRIIEVGDDLGMHQAMSQSPSKPVAPVDGRCRGRSMGAGAGGGKVEGRRVQPRAFFARITRCFSRCQSRSFSASRLSCACLPRARPSSTLTLFFFQYIAVGTRV